MILVSMQVLKGLKVRLLLFEADLGLYIFIYIHIFKLLNILYFLEK